MSTAYAKNNPTPTCGHHSSVSFARRYEASIHAKHAKHVVLESSVAAPIMSMGDATKKRTAARAASEPAIRRTEKKTAGTVSAE